ncbi:hypothetical protein, partial [Mesorhizobium sp.]|uniref:hypothetical protein n=1 Tax=Mesorhizobium sp. TaxID=1871066 RepID=UPI0025D3E0B6
AASSLSVMHLILFLRRGWEAAAPSIVPLPLVQWRKDNHSAATKSHPNRPKPPPNASPNCQEPSP